MPGDGLVMSRVLLYFVEWNDAEDSDQFVGYTVYWYTFNKCKSLSKCSPNPDESYQRPVGWQGETLVLIQREWDKNNSKMPKADKAETGWPWSRACLCSKSRCLLCFSNF